MYLRSQNLFPNEIAGEEFEVKPQKQKQIKTSKKKNHPQIVVAKRMSKTLHSKLHSEYGLNLLACPYNT